MMIGYMDRTAGAVEHCESMALNHPGVVSEAYLKLADYCKRKLWHQLTLLVLEMLENPETFCRDHHENDGSHSFLSLYDKVVLCVDSKLNPLSLSKIASLVAQSIVSYDGTAAKAILENLLAKFKEKQQEKQKFITIVPATIYVQSKLSSLVLTTPALMAEAEMATSTNYIINTLKANKEVLQQYPAEENSELATVHAAHYEAAMLYYQRVGPPEAFYEQALSYLQHMGPNFIDNKKAAVGAMISPMQLAIGFIVAALTGEGVYNLGQVEQTPVLKLLMQNGDHNNNHVWLVQLLQATAAGNVTLFRHYEIIYAKQIETQPALVHRKHIMTEKLTLLALVTLVFSKPSHERKLTFQEIAEFLQVQDINLVEWIVMRALSLHLIEGFMDQVEQTLTVTWVMPRVLNNQQMQYLAARLAEWANKVANTQATMNAAIL